MFFIPGIHFFSRCFFSLHKPLWWDILRYTVIITNQIAIVSISMNTLQRMLCDVKLVNLKWIWSQRDKPRKILLSLKKYLCTCTFHMHAPFLITLYSRLVNFRLASGFDIGLRYFVFSAHASFPSFSSTSSPPSDFLFSFFSFPILFNARVVVKINLHYSNVFEIELLFQYHSNVSHTRTRIVLNNLYKDTK